MDNEVFFGFHAQVMRNALQERNQDQYESSMDSFLKSYYGLSLANRYPFKNLLIDTYYNYGKLRLLLGDARACLEQLKKAIHLGFTDFSKLEDDGDFDTLKNHQEYITLIRGTKQAKDFLQILKRSKYASFSKEIFQISVAEKQAQDLLLPEGLDFNLEKIAGTGTAINRIINMMYWVHSTVRHDGENGDLDHLGLQDKLRTCITENKGLNCRGLASLFNSIMLAMNFKSRIVLCKPENALGIDKDCHVINIVYVDTLQKWVWVDVTLCAYIMNEEGTLLSVEEVRSRLVQDQPLILNPDANWNNRHTLSKSEYIYKYMAKNLYYFVSPVTIKCVNYLNTGKERSVDLYLLPLEMKNKNTLTGGSDLNEEIAETDYIITYSPSLFWQSPAGSN